MEIRWNYMALAGMITAITGLATLNLVTLGLGVLITFLSIFMYGFTLE